MTLIDTFWQKKNDKRTRISVFIFETMSVGEVLPGLPIAVDSWKKYPGVEHYFLTHMHGGKDKKFYKLFKLFYIHIYYQLIFLFLLFTF